MPVDAETTEEGIAGLFVMDAVEREAAVARFACAGENGVAVLMQIVLRPLNSALVRWPEWQEMLPARAILARCAGAQQAAMQALIAIGGPSVPELARLLQSHDANLRQQAADALRQIDSPAAAAVLRQRLEQEMASHRRQKRIGNFQRAVWGLSTALLVIMLWPRDPYQPDYGLLVGSTMGLVVWLLAGFADRNVGVRQAAVVALEQTGDTRHVGVLAACLSDPDKTVRQSVAHALTQLLPTVRVQDRKHLSSGEMKALLRALDGDDPELAVAVLAAMQQIGDARILSRVAFLIDSPVHFESVRSAAQECLPHVKLRIQEIQQAQVLLRPAPEQAVVADLLLRPARETAGQTASEQLLRPL